MIDTILLCLIVVNVIQALYNKNIVGFCGWLMSLILILRILGMHG